MPTITKVQRLKTKNKRTTTEGRFKLKTSAIQAAVVALELKGTPTRPSGGVALDGDWLNANVPSDHDALQAYLSHEKLQKILRTYLDLYSKTGQVFPRINTLGPRSGRRSYTKPNVQNVPKRKWGIRGLFVPRPGHYFIKCDYTAQELFTLTQAMIDLGIGRGPLWDCVTSDQDPHILGATKTLGKPYDQITKEDRQGEKVVAFGVPGGLGPKSLRDYAFKTFGVRWEKADAKLARDRFLAAFPDVAAFLQHLKRPQRQLLLEYTGHTQAEWQEMLECGWNVVGALCEHTDPDWRLLGERMARSVPGVLRTGRIRSGARFTEVANTHFQGLAADVTKHAEWRLFRRFGWPPTIVCHDEVVMEFPNDAFDCRPRDAADAVKAEMLAAFVDICPDVGPYAKAEVSNQLWKWGADTNAEGEVI